MVLTAFTLQDFSHAADDLLGNRIRKQSSDEKKFLPRYLLQQQQKQEDLINRKNEGFDLGDSLDSDLTNRLRKRKQTEEEDPRRSAAQEPGERPDFELSDFDEEGNPQELTIYEYEGDGASRRLKRTTSYDIRGMDSGRWMAAGREVSGENGKKSFQGFSKIGMEDIKEELEDRKRSVSHFTGEAGSEKISYVESGFDENGHAGIIDKYSYAGGALKEVLTYDVAGLDVTYDEKTGLIKNALGLLSEDVLTRKAIYSGAAGKEEIQEVFSDYGGEGDERAPKSYEVYDYDGGTLKETRSYDVSESFGAGDWEAIRAKMRAGDASMDGELVTETVFEGGKGT